MSVDTSTDAVERLAYELAVLGYVSPPRDPSHYMKHGIGCDKWLMIAETLATVAAERDALRATLWEIDLMVDEAKVRPTDAARWLNQIEETARVALAPKEGA